MSPHLCYGPGCRYEPCVKTGQVVHSSQCVPGGKKGRTLLNFCEQLRFVYVNRDWISGSGSGSEVLTQFTILDVQRIFSETIDNL